MSTDDQFRDEPCFVISVAARIVGVHAQTLRHYERVGLIWPSRTATGTSSISAGVVRVLTGCTW